MDLLKTGKHLRKDFSRKFVFLKISYILFCMILFFQNNNTFAYNSEKCRNTRPTEANKHIGSSVFFQLTSSTQFSSSWGECAAFGKVDQREIFFIKNRDLILSESAVGIGEYIDTFAILSGYENSKDIEKFKELIKSEFQILFFNGLVIKPNAEILAKIDNLLKKDQSFNKHNPLRKR